MRPRCGSSVVEHSLGKGEVVGSIPPRSTIKARTSRSAIPAPEQTMAFQRNRIIERRAALCVRIEARAQRPQEEAEIGAFAVLALQQPRGSLHELARHRAVSR